MKGFGEQSVNLQFNLNRIVALIQYCLLPLLIYVLSGLVQTWMSSVIQNYWK